MADTKAEEQDRRLIGLGVSRGVGRGKVVFIKPGTRQLVKRAIADDEINNEIERFRAAVHSSRIQLDEIADSSTDGDDHGVSDIFKVQLLILDSSFIQKIEDLIQADLVNAEWAVRTVLASYADLKASLPEERFREKHLDLEDVAARLIRSLQGGRPTVFVEPHSVAVAHELRPSAVIDLATNDIAGVITETGGWTSHTSIVARQYHLPMVTGIRNIDGLISSGEVVTVDGNTGEVILGTQSHASHGRTLSKSDSESWAGNRVFTTDGVEVVIQANANDESSYDLARKLGARGIGLFRSESLISDSGILPTEDEQFLAYSKIARVVATDRVAIRTFDISVEELPLPNGAYQINPALGVRGIRCGLMYPDVFRTQIRALLRASAEGAVDIILPMISNVEEVIRARTIIDEIRADLTASGIRQGSPRIGIMIEVPSAVLAVARLVKHADFLCLGTNDLVQYLLAADRDNTSVATWYQTLHPAVLSAIRIVLESASEARVPTIVCGEMAASTFYAPVLLGLGTRIISLNRTAIEPLSKLISGISTADASSLVKMLEKCDTSEETEKSLRDYYLQNWEEFFPKGLITARYL